MRGLPGAGPAPPRPELLGVPRRSRSAAGQARFPSLRGLRNAPRAPVPRLGTRRVLEARNRALRRVMSRTRDPHWSLSRHALAPASSVDLNRCRVVTPATRTPRAAVARPSPDTRPPPADHRPLTSRHGSRVADHLPTSARLPVTGRPSVWKSGGRPASQEASSFPRRCSRLALRVWKSAALPPALLASVTVMSPQFGASVTAS